MMRSLAQVRKLLKPKVAQINIGEKQQINTGTAAALEPVEPHKTSHQTVEQGGEIPLKGLSPKLEFANQPMHSVYTESRKIGLYRSG